MAKKQQLQNQEQDQSKQDNLDLKEKTVSNSKKTEEKKDKKQKKGLNMFRCQKIEYKKDNAGYVINSTFEVKNTDGTVSIVEKDPMKLHDDKEEGMIKEMNAGITAPIFKDDIDTLNAQSLNTGIFYKKL